MYTPIDDSEKSRLAEQDLSDALAEMYRSSSRAYIKKESEALAAWSLSQLSKLEAERLIGHNHD